MTQPNLFDNLQPDPHGAPIYMPSVGYYSHPPAQEHSAPSRAARDEIEPKAATFRRQVLEYLRECGAEGATDEEMQAGLSMNPNTQRPRRCELHAAGLVIDSGRTRLTKSKRKATVWTAAT